MTAIVTRDLEEVGPMVGAAEVAWCGGVVDAMGRLTVRDTPAGSMLPRVTVSSVHLPFIQRLCDLTGVKVIVVKRDYNRMGCGEHCTDAHLHVVSVTARFQLTGARARTFLLAVRPYLFIKADEADMILEASKDARSKPATTAKMRAMGWPA